MRLYQNTTASSQSQCGYVVDVFEVELMSTSSRYDCGGQGRAAAASSCEEDAPARARIRSKIFPEVHMNNLQCAFCCREYSQ